MPCDGAPAALPGPGPPLCEGGGRDRPAQLLAVLTALVAATGVAGLVVGALVSRAAARYAPVLAGAAQPVVAAGVRLPAAVPVVATAGLFAGLAARFGASWQLPAFLLLAAVGVLLAVVDMGHKLLPDRFVLPSLAAGTVLLVLAAAGEGAWPPLLRAVLGAVVLFAVFLVLALISPSGLGMGDVKLAALLGLYLGWLGWGVLVVGAFAGFVVQAVLALVLLATRRIALQGELPFGPAMLAGAAIAVFAGSGWLLAIA